MVQAFSLRPMKADQPTGVPLAQSASPQARAARNRETGTMASISRLMLSPW